MARFEASSQFERVSITLHPFSGHWLEAEFTGANNGPSHTFTWGDGGVLRAHDDNAHNMQILKTMYAGLRGFLGVGGPAPIDIQPNEFGFISLADIGGSPLYENLFGSDDDAGGGITTYAERFHNAILWRRSVNKPANPPADWWEVANNRLVANLNGWYLTRQVAHDAWAGSSGAPTWFALGSVRVMDDGTKEFTAWTVQAEFQVEYSADGITWRTAQQTGDRYFGFRTPEGMRRVVEIGAAQTPGWTQIYIGSPYNTGGGGYADFGGSVNLNQFARLRFRWRPYGYEDSDGNARSLGAEIFGEFHRPEEGWQSATGRRGADNDAAQAGTFAWIADEQAGGLIVHHGAGGRSTIELPDSVVRPGTDAQGRGYPARRLAGRSAFVGALSSTPHIVQGLDQYYFVPGLYYQRFELRIEGATV